MTSNAHHSSSDVAVKSLEFIQIYGLLIIYQHLAQNKDTLPIGQCTMHGACGLHKVDFPAAKNIDFSS